ncbi:catalase family peroxidase [Salinicola sp. CPA57]|uniref:catalase family peroxidase n=1 Tax=Salinicola sp. CPA57 TaxID=1949080 RepID=UPI000DA2285E|nr:catalase family peroxidase [Salinicola sp. CPA57]
MTLKTPPPLNTIFRFTVIGLVIAILATAFAYVGGWLDPGRLTPDRMINTLEDNAGVHEGYRRNHAKGYCVVGRFESNGNAASLSRASVFEAGQQSPLIGRFAIPGGNPNANDGMPPIRSFALQFQLSNDEQWRTAMNAMPVFPVSTPQAFWELLKASQPDSQSGKPDAAKMSAFFADHPETKPFLAWAKTAQRSSSFVNVDYNSLDAFRFIDAAGTTHFVRWGLVPEAPFTAMTDAQKQDPDFLSKDLRERLEQGPQRWHLIVAVANPGDPTNDATLVWPEDRRQIDAGVVTIESAQAQADGPCRDINYDPLVLPDGIAGSDDPLLSARSAAYSESYNRRTREEAESATPSTQEPQS